MEKMDIIITSEIQYVSRGGHKLEKALNYFGIPVEGRICIDSGASTGGFTDCLLQKGAKMVYAIDVGYGQLAWTLRNDERVITMERTNIRYVIPEMIPVKPNFAVLDLSFISLALVLPVIRELLNETGEIICLIKPQFEAGKGKVGKKGVVRDPKIHIEVLDNFIKNATGSGFNVKGMTHSPLKGPKGNIEYLSWLDLAENDNENTAQIDISKIITEAHNEL